MFAKPPISDHTLKEHAQKCMGSRTMILLCYFDLYSVLLPQARLVKGVVDHGNRRHCKVH